jgi:predicted TIM-barrel fold metal-dependent hydrolase
MTPIIDTHQHLWNLAHFKLSWMTSGHPLGRSFTTVDYAAATAGLNIVKSVYMEVDVLKEQQQAEADFVIGLCRLEQTTMVAAVVGGWPADPGFEKYARQFEGSEFVKGIRQVIHVESTPPGYCLQPEFIRGVQLLGDLGLSFDICIRPGELADAVKLVDACPGTRFILDHCGNGDVQARDRTTWKQQMAELGKRRNLVCKVSGIVASAEKGKWTANHLAPIVNHTIDCFGWDRVMFGGDWPVCTPTATYRQWVDALQAIVKHQGQANQKMLFHDNAASFYGLGPDKIGG